MAGRGKESRTSGGDAPFPDLVPEGDARRLVAALALARGPRGFTVAEAAAVLSWAQKTRGNHAFLELTLKGFVEVDVGPDGDIRWNRRENKDVGPAARALDSVAARLRPPGP